MDYMNIAIEEAYKALNEKEVPIGAVVVKNNEIIASAHNERKNKNDVISHAEITAIREAGMKLNDWRLDECDLYVTLEPCNMCKEVIKQARIKSVYYLLPKLEFKKEYSKTNICMCNMNNEIIEEYKEKLSEFFKINCNR